MRQKGHHMSTTARKRRKRISRLAESIEMPNAARGFRFQHPVKEGTPVVERSHLQARSIFGKGPHSQPTRYGITSRMRRELNAYGVGAPAGE